MAVRGRAARLAMVGVAGLVVLGGAGTILLGGERSGIQVAGSVARAEVPSTGTLDQWGGRSRLRTTPSTTATTMPPTTVPTTTPVATTTSTAPPLDPGPCPSKLPQATFKTSQGLLVVGSSAFLQHSETSLSLLEARAKESFEAVSREIILLQSVDSGSGMCVNSGTFRVGSETAYPPGYGLNDQAIWFASAMVHDANHRAQQRAGRRHEGRDAELECLLLQRDALARLGAIPFVQGYIQGTIDGIDDPRNQYWTNPNPHW